MTALALGGFFTLSEHLSPLGTEYDTIVPLKWVFLRIYGTLFLNPNI